MKQYILHRPRPYDVLVSLLQHVEPFLVAEEPTYIMYQLYFFLP